MSVKVLGLRPGDWLRSEAPGSRSRAVRTVLSGQSLKCGQLGYRNADGKVLALVATGNETHTYAFTGTPTSGTFTVTLWHKDGYWVTTAAIPYNESQANVIIALNQALIGADSGAVTSVVTGAGVAITAFTVVHSGTGWASKEFPLGQCDISLLPGVTACTVTRSTSAGTARNEVQTVTLSAAMSAGTYGLVLYTPTGVPLTVKVAWDTIWATTMAAINAAITAAATAWYGGASVGAVMTGTDTVQVLTFSGVGFVGKVIPDLAVALVQATTGPTSASVARTTSGGRVGERLDALAYGIAFEDTDASSADKDGVFIEREAVYDQDTVIYGGGDPTACQEVLALSGLAARSHSSRAVLP